MDNKAAFKAWLAQENAEHTKLKWVLKYLRKKGFSDRHPLESYETQILAWHSEGGMGAEKKEEIRLMKLAWRQHLYRNQETGIKSCSFLLSEEVKENLIYLTKLSRKSQTLTISKLIDQAAAKARKAEQKKLATAEKLAAKAAKNSPMSQKLKRGMDRPEGDQANIKLKAVNTEQRLINPYLLNSGFKAHPLVFQTVFHIKG